MSENHPNRLSLLGKGKERDSTEVQLVRKESKLRLTKKRKRKWTGDATNLKEEEEEAKDKDKDKSVMKRLIPVPSFTPRNEEEEKEKEETNGKDHLDDSKNVRDQRLECVVVDASHHSKPLIDLNRKVEPFLEDSNDTSLSNKNTLETVENKHGTVMNLTISSEKRQNVHTPSSTVSIPTPTPTPVPVPVPVPLPIPLPNAASTLTSPSSEFKKEPRTKRLAKQEKELTLRHEDLLHQSKHIVTSSTTITATNTTVQRRKQNARSKTLTSTNVSSTSTSSSKSYKLCTLCSTCSCAQGSTLTSLEQNALNEQQQSKGMPLGLARTDAEIERALIGRLARLEKSASWFDSLCGKVNKELKRHRKKMIMKRHVHKDYHHHHCNNNNRPRNNVFLQDVDEIEDDMKSIMGPPSLSKNFVGKVMNKAFTFRKKHQPTLTQMLEEHDEEHDREHDKETDENHETSHASIVGVDCQELNTSTVEYDVNDKRNEDQEDVDQVDTSLAQEDIEHEDSVGFNIARYRGKAKNLWTASKLSKEKMHAYQLYDVNIPDMNEFDTKTSNVYDDHHGEDGFLELLNTFEIANSSSDDSNINKGEREGNGFFHNANEMLQMNGSSSLKHQEVNISQLSPQAKSIHKTIVSSIETEPSKLSILEEVFPSWKENQRFILCQNSKDLKFALENVQTRRTHIQKMIELLTKQNVALEIFEDTITHAMDRHTDDKCQVTLEDDPIVTECNHNIF